MSAPDLDTKIRFRFAESLMKEDNVERAAWETCKGLRDEAKEKGWGEDSAATLFIYAAERIASDIAAFINADQAGPAPLVPRPHRDTPIDPGLSAPDRLELT